MDEIVIMSEAAQEYWDYVVKLHQITGGLLKEKDALKDPNEKNMRIVFNIQNLVPIQEDEDNN